MQKSRIKGMMHSHYTRYIISQIYVHKRGIPINREANFRRMRVDGQQNRHEGQSTDAQVDDPNKMTHKGSGA
jgi:hypothetical protein